MIKSMTGFAARTREDSSATVSLTIKTVNHRHLDLQIRLPSQLAPHEPELRRAIQRRLSRGRVELVVTWQPRRPAAVDVEVNEAFVNSLAAALDRVRAQGLVTGEFSVSDLLRHPQAITVREHPAWEEENGRQLVDEALEEALGELDAMRAAEGARLAADLEERLRLIEHLVDRISGVSEAGREVVETRLRERVRELTCGLDVDAAGLAAEIVRLAARSDITEELVRIRAHLGHWRALTEGSEPCGRRLDFLVQEMHRELNTIGAKADGVAMPELVVTAKAELERVREQVQNVE